LLGEAVRQVGTATIHRRLDFMRDALLAADRILAPSEFLRQRFIEEGLSADRVEFWENGHDPERFVGQAERRAAHPAQGRVRFGFVGTLIPNKGPELLVRAFQDLPVGRATLDIHGRGGGPKGVQYEASLAALNRHPDLRFHGPFDNARVGEVLAGLDVLVVPSLWFENSPLTLNEAALAGLAVVTSDFGGMRELADRFGHALVFPVGDQAALTATLRRFLDEPGLALSLSKTHRPVRTIEEDAAGQIARYRDLLRGQPGPDGAG
ncbi:MAG: glycosyltransferase, partial [Planctomycetes bacterium]|nr:glycosyltransferase [Planctomycetota bacterium]